MVKVLAAGFGVIVLVSMAKPPSRKDAKMFQNRQESFLAFKMIPWRSWFLGGLREIE